MLSCITLASLGLSELGAFALVIVERLDGCVAKASSRKSVDTLVKHHLIKYITYCHGCPHRDERLPQRALLPPAAGCLYPAISIFVMLKVSLKVEAVQF
jgi:hypothetical protein